MSYKSKTCFFILIIICLFLSFQYYDLLYKFNKIQKQEKSVLLTYLKSCIDNAEKINIEKLLMKENNSILYLINMYEGISNANIVLWTIFKGNIEIIDPMYTAQYTKILKNILEKSLNGNLELKDIRNLKLLIENIKIIYKYIYENNKFIKRDFEIKVLPQLKAIQT